MDDQRSTSPAYIHVDSFTAKGHGTVPAGAFIVPDANLLFHGDFKRAGVDLILSNDDHEFVLHDYFRGEKRAAIASPDGAHLTGDIVNALAGHVQYAQAAPGAGAAQVIGHVTKMTGSATAIRNGVSIILNQGDNVEKGDVVSTGSDSTLGITFIDGTVFGLSNNARMVLNEMVYDPNGSNNSSLLSLVAGTITFVAGQTAKHGDMKIDTPVATMGIRGTAVLTEINFTVPSGGGDPQPQANFQVLVEPDGTTGSYILFDKITLLPIATVNQAGQMIQISGGNVSVTNALLSPDVQKLITDVFTLKFTDNNTNTKLTTNSTDTITPDSNGFTIKTASGATAEVKVVNTVNTGNDGQQQTSGDKPSTNNRIPGAPQARSLDFAGHLSQAFSLGERSGQTNVGTDLDTVSGTVSFLDFNLGDRPTVKVNLADVYTYKDAGQHDVTASLSALQKQDIAATEVKIVVLPASGNNNNGSATWTYSVPDNAFDFLAAGETLTLNYIIRVDNNFEANNETAFIPISITITGTNDKPVVTTDVPTIVFAGGTSVPGGPLTSDVPTSGTLTFTDVDLTDTHTVSVQLTGATLPDGTVPPGPLAIFQHALSVSIANNHDSTGTGTGTVNWSLADLPVYLADFIPKDEVLTLTYTVTVTDSQGATATQTITVTITGTDHPAVVWIATTQAGLPPGGLWKEAANWETGTVPTINDDVIVITDQLHGLTPSYPVTIDAAAFAKSLTMNDFGGPPPELINQSTLTISGALNMSADSILTNASTGTIIVGGKAEILDTSKLSNAGVLELQAGGDIGSQVDLTNSGTIDLVAGTLNLLADIANAGGTVQVDAGARLVVDSATVDGGTVAISGTLDLDGASVLENGIITNSGVVTVKGTVAFDDETVTNNRTIEIKAGSALTIDQGSSVSNSGFITVDADGKLVLDHASIDGAGTVTGNGEIDLTGSAVLSNGVLANTKTIKISGSDNKLDNETVTNAATGLIEVLAGGVLAIAATTAATFTNDGTIQVDGGELDVNGEPIGNTGTFAAINHGTVKLTSTTLTNIGSGAVSVDATSTLDLVGATIDGGTLTISGTLESTGISAINDADITNSGTITVTSGRLTIDPPGSFTITNYNVIEADGGELDVVGEDIANNGTLEAVNGGTLRLATLLVTNTHGTVTVGSGSKLYLTNVEINGGMLGNAGHLYGVSGSNTVTAVVTNTGIIEVQGGTLDLAGGLSGAGALIIDNGGTLELAGATAQTITFNGGTDTLRLDDVAGQHFDGTIAGISSASGTFIVTGAGNITTSNGDALDFTSDGGASGAPATLFLTLSGNITGAARGLVAIQNGTGDVNVMTGGTIVGQAGEGIVARVGANGHGNIVVTTTGSVAGTGTGINGLLAQNLNVSDSGNVTVTATGGVSGTQNAILAAASGSGNVSVDAAGAITSTLRYGIRAQTSGTGKISVVTEAGTVMNTGGAGISAVNFDTNVPTSAHSTITVTANGTINFGPTTNLNGTVAKGIDAGFYGAGAANTAINGTVTINNFSNVIQTGGTGGYGINAFNYGNGDVTLNDGALTTVVAAEVGISAFGLAGGTGNVAIDVAAGASITGGSSYGIEARNTNAGNVSVKTKDGVVITSGNFGIFALNTSTALTSAYSVTVDVGADTIHSHAGGGINAGYWPGSNSVAPGTHGNVFVTSNATITADGGGYGINAYNWGTGNVTVVTGASSSITASGVGILAQAFDGGNVSATIAGTATGTTGLFAKAVGAGNITIENDGTLTATATAGISVNQSSQGAMGSTSITNHGSVVGAAGHAAIYIQENATGTAVIDNSGTIGPDEAGTVTSSTFAIVETGGAITINNTNEINGNISVATATFNNELSGTWTVAGTSVFGTTSLIDNAGQINLNGASISGDGLDTDNHGNIDSWGIASISGTVTNTGNIEVNDGSLTLFGSLSGSGSVTLHQGATLELDGTVSVAQTVTFTGSGASELQIDATTFGGTISGLGVGDKIDLSSIHYDLATTTATYNSATHELTVTDVYSHSITLKLDGDYSNAHFAGSDDGHGGTVVTLNAANDTPNLAAAETPQSTSFAELADTTGSSTPDPVTPATGTIHFTDVDLTDRPTATITDQQLTWTDTNNADLSAGLTEGEKYAIKHALTLSQTDRNSGAVDWSYSIADGALDFLGEGQTVTLTSTITLDDHQTGTDTAQVIVTITGKNDAPTISIQTGDQAGAELNETNAGLTAGGSLTLKDVDATDHVTLAVTQVQVSLDGVPQAGPVDGLSLGTLQTYLTVPTGDVLNGTANHAQFSWNFNSQGHAFDFLGAGQTLSLQYTIVPNDGHTPTGTGDGIVTINIAGTNDAPVFAGTDLASTYHSNGNAVAVAADVSASDIDSDNYSGGSLTATVTAGGHQGDTLSIANNAFITVSGGVVSFDADGAGSGAAVEIGILTGGINTLTVALNGNATDAAIAALTQAIQFQNSLSNPVLGSRTVTFTLHDGGGTANGGHDSATFDATVEVANNPPTASDVGASGNEDATSVTIDFAGTDSDGTLATIKIATLPAHGQLYADAGLTQLLHAGDTIAVATVGATSAYFVPDHDWSGSTDFTYFTIDDGGLQSTSAGTATIDIAPAADTPTYAADLTPKAATDEFIVNSTTANDQTYSAVGALSDGGYVIAWVSQGQDGWGTGIYAQHYSNSGAPVGSEFLVNTATAGDQSGPYVVGLEGGGFVVSWTSGHDNGSTIHLQRYDASGAAAGNEIALSGYGEGSALAALPTGGFVLTYGSFDGSATGTSALIYDANGNAISGPILINTVTANYQSGDSVAATADGGFVASWHSYGQDTPNSWGVYFQRFDAQGNKLGGEVQVNTNTAGDQYGGELAVLKDGSIVVSYTDAGALVLRHFSSAGTPIGNEFRIAGATTDTVQALPDGGFVVTYQGNDGPGSLGLLGQHFDASLNPVGSSFVINQTTAGDQVFLADRSNPTAVTTDGHIVSSWFGPGVNGSDVYARVFELPAVGGENTPIKLPTITAAATDTDGSEALVIKLSGFPSGATFSVGQAGTGVDQGTWIISGAQIGSLATTPLTMTLPHNFSGDFTLHVSEIVTDTAQLSSGTTTDQKTFTHDVAVTVVPGAGTVGVDQAPSITGDLATSVVKGGAVKLTGLGAGASADLVAVDSDNTPDQLVYTVTHANHGHLANSLGGPAIVSFTQADLDGGHVFFVADDSSYAGGANFTVSLSDGVPGAATATATVGINVVDAQIVVRTSDGFDFDRDDPITAFGAGQIQDGYSATTFTVTNAAANRDFIVKGTGLAFAGTGAELHLVGGTITSIDEQTHDTSAALVTFMLNVPAVDWMNGTIAQAHRDNSLMEALIKPWTFNVIGNSGPDNVGANLLNDVFTGNAGNDTFDGGYGYDRANYGNSAGSIDVQLAAGIVTGDASVGTDTLKSIELVTGSNFNDTYDARGFNSSSDNAGSVITANTAGMFNEFEGRGGDDTIIGNGATRVSYSHATSAVTVTFNANSWTTAGSGGSGTATGDASTGTDTFTGVFAVRGSSYGDHFYGSNNPLGSAEEFEGRGGDDYIDGGAGFDRARYDGAVDGVGINVNLAAGIVTGGSDTGTDTLRSIEAIWGTNYADIYDATGFTALSTNAGSAGVNGSGAAFNEFEGGGGNDLVTGNGNTRVNYTHANSGVTVTLGSSGSGDAYGDSSVGHDHFYGGVNAVRGSEFNDIITGNGGNNTLEGRGGNDVLDGGGGNDVLSGGTGSDIFVYKPGDGVTTITDFSHASDRIDLRAFAGVHGIGDLTFAFSGSTLTITSLAGGFNDDNHKIVIQGYNSASNPVTASDFIFANPSGDSVAVTVQTLDGYDFSTLYTDMSVSTLATAANTVDHIFAVDHARGITFELIGSSFNYDSGTHQVTGGTITEIDILSGTDPTQITQDHVLVNSNGWKINATNFFSALTQYGSSDPSTHASGKLALDNIFGSAAYSYVGSGGGYDGDGRPHDGADTFVGGNNADVFNGLPGPFGPLDPGHDTVDYSNASGPISVNLLTGATSGTAAAGDIFISIENLRGSKFGDTLIGDGNNNTLEGGAGDDTIDGGGGFNTASYEHASTGVTVSLAVSGQQDTVGAGLDTLSNIQALRGSAFDDTLTGNGSSVLEGGLGHNHLVGQSGQSDTASYEHASSGVHVDLSIATAQDTVGAGIDTLTNIANLAGSHFNDVLTGDSHDNTFMGNGGNDIFVFKQTKGGIGHDTIGDFVSGQSHIELDYAAFDASGAASFNAWYSTHVHTNGGDLLIDLSLSGTDGKDTILLKNASIGGLHANDFILHQ